MLRPGAGGEALVRRIGLQPDEVRARLEAGGGRGRARAAGSADEPAHTSHAKRLIQSASKEARESGSEISAEHLLLAALHEPRGAMARILSDAGIAPARVRAELGPTPSEPVRPPRERGSRGPHPGLPAHLQKTPTPRWRLILLLAVPISIALSYVFHAPAVWVFLTACIGVLPLAAFMGEATEHLAHRTSPTVGGLLNATFGNAAELIIALMALRAGLVDLVKASITGSILGNLLLIMGLALVAGGLDRPQLRFNRTTAGMSAGMLALSVVALTFPALYHAVHPEAAARAAELHMSEAVALILILTYGCSLLFTLRTHRRLLGGEAHPVEGPVWGTAKALAILGGATVGVAVESELLVHAATDATEALGVSSVFLGLIIIPIIGNAAEHAAAVVLARKGQIDLGLQIALGSSTQVALLVAPLLVFAGVLMGTGMDLVFRPFEVVALGMATVVTAIITLDGESHWFEGVQLLAVYLMVAVGAYFL